MYDKTDTHLQIRDQTYGTGSQVDIWKSKPYKHISTRNFNNESQAKSFAKSYMKKHDVC